MVGFEHRGWLDLSNSGGVLNPSETTQVTLSFLDTVVSNFSADTYDGEVTFLNTDNGYGSTTRDVELALYEPGPTGGGDNVGQRPGPNNTGPTSEALLQPYEGPTNITQDNTVIENAIFSGPIHIKANNVTIRNFRSHTNANYSFRCTYGYQNFVLEDGEITGPGTAGVYGGNYTARRLDVFEVANDAFKSDHGNVLVEGCWMHHLGLTIGTHADGFQVRTNSGYTLRGNFFDMPAPEGPNGPGDPYSSNAAIIINTSAGPVSNVLIENNWMNGGNYTIYLNSKNGNPPPQNAVIRNNVFGPDFRYGIMSSDANPETCGNTWEYTGLLIQEGDSGGSVNPNADATFSMPSQSECP